MHVSKTIFFFQTKENSQEVKVKDSTGSQTYSKNYKHPKTATKSNFKKRRSCPKTISSPKTHHKEKLPALLKAGNNTVNIIIIQPISSIYFGIEARSCKQKHEEIDTSKLKRKQRKLSFCF